MASDDENLRCEVHDFPSFSVRFANVINKDIRCYRFLLQKLQGFVELVKCDDYLRTFQVEPSDIFLNISLLQQDVSVRNDRRSLGLENSERILEREGDSNEGTSWLLECKPAARPLVHLRELFDKLKQEGRLDPGGLAAVIDSLETEDREMEEMFAESIQKFLDVSSAVNDAFDKLRHGARQWLPKREETIARLKELAGQLDKTTRDVAITQAVGSSVGIVGGLVAIVGLALAPLTLGSSLIPAAIAGGVIGGAGALTAVGSTVAEIVIDKNLVDQAIGRLEEDRTLTDALVGQMSDFKESSSLLLRYIPQDELEYLISAATYDRSSANPDLAPKPGDIGPRLGITVSRLVAVGGKAIAMPVTKMLVAGTVAASKIAAMAVSHSIAAIGIGLDIANIIIAAKKLEKGAKYENAAQLERAIADLEKGKRVIADTYLDSEDSDLI